MLAILQMKVWNSANVLLTSYANRNTQIQAAISADFHSVYQL